MAEASLAAGGTLRSHAVRVRVQADIASALEAGDPVVALESSVLAQGLPIPSNREAAERMMAGVERGGARAAITAVVRGHAALGLEST